MRKLMQIAESSGISVEYCRLPLNESITIQDDSGDEVIIVFYDLYLKLCKEKNISPTRAAIEIGISKATPTTWKKRGLTPQGETLNKIANYFDVSVDYLLTGEKEKASALEGERTVSDEEIKLALFGGKGEVTDEMWEEAKFAVQLIKDRYKRKKGE